MSRDTVRDLADPSSLRQADRAERRYRRALEVGVVLAVCLVLAAGVVMIVLLLQTRNLAADVESCIVPGGDCYERATLRYEEASGDRDRILEVLCEVRPTSEECS